MSRITIRCYSELIRLPTFEERFQYLRLDGLVGKETFGFDRYLNQNFYHSKEWRSIRDQIINRDCACDLAVPDREIFGKVYIHHMNPISVSDIESFSEMLADPEYLICVSHNTHNAIHYGDESLLTVMPKARQPNDTCPWKVRKESANG